MLVNYAILERWVANLVARPAVIAAPWGLNQEISLKKRKKMGDIAKGVSIPVLSAKKNIFKTMKYSLTSQLRLDIDFLIQDLLFFCSTNPIAFCSDSSGRD